MIKKQVRTHMDPSFRAYNFVTLEKRGAVVDYACILALCFGIGWALAYYV